MKTILTASLLVMGFVVSNAEAGYPNQADAYATAVDQEAHHLDKDLHEAFPQYVSLIQKVHQLKSLSHTTEQLVLNRDNLPQAEYNVDLMQKTLGSIDKDLHFIAENHPHFQAQKTVHLLKMVHQLDSHLETLEDEVHDLNHVVILPYPYPGYGYNNGYGYGYNHHHGNDHVVIQPAGIHIHKGGFALNLPF